MIMCRFVNCFIIVCVLFIQPSWEDSTEEARKWLEEYDQLALTYTRNEVQAEWDYNTNITDETSKASLKASAAIAAFSKEKGKEAQKFILLSINDKYIRRQIKSISQLGISALAAQDVDKFHKLENDMQSIYSTAKICPPTKASCNIKKEGWSLEPEIEDFLVHSKNYNQLASVWEQWRDVSGKKMINKYMEYVGLGNKAAKLNNFLDYGDMWVDSYQMDMDTDFKEEMHRLWNEILPLYEQLHAYVRYKLRILYAKHYQRRKDDPIPAHIFGNMWAQSWSNIYDIVKPFQKTSEIDITNTLQDKKYTTEEVFKIADDFFHSIGQRGMPDSFYNLSMLEKPKDRDVVCHASAWDFFDKSDVRIKMCTNMDMEDFITVHHEMGHCEYFLLYENQPITFREGANSGFHEAVGDTIALSVQTPQHLAAVGLLQQPEDTEEFNINYLMKIALEKLAFLPFGYLIDLYRWQIFSGKTTQDTLNHDWWKLREEYQGIIPPVKRSKDDFDAGGKFHVAAGVPYIRYFVSHILQFSFYKSACTAAGEYPKVPLHKCDFYKSEAAGESLTKGLKLGSSLPWPQTLELMTGEERISSSAIMEYFQPLREYLENFNRDNNVPIGWNIGVYKQYVQ